MKIQKTGANYVSPKIEQIDIKVEKGFATSLDGTEETADFSKSNNYKLWEW